MKNNFKFIAVAAFSLAIGLSINNFAASDVPANYKVAVVDVQSVVNNSAQVKALKKEQKDKVSELTKFVQTAKANISKETDATKKKALEDKYTKELTTKKAAIEKNYTTKIKTINKNITDVIQAQAKAGNYNLVLSKAVVLAGGEDITQAISKALK